MENFIVDMILMIIVCFLFQIYICVKMLELKVEYWNSEKDGVFNEISMRNKLKL